MFRPTLILTLLALAAGGCSGPKPLGGAPTIRVVEMSSLPAPSDDSRDSVYRVGGRDKLLVDVFGIEELKGREIETDISGGLSIPLAGRIEAVGMSLAELEDAITDRLRSAYVRDPQVSVNPIEIRSRRVTVDGSVREPGLYPVPDKMTLMQAVAQAKGVGEFAKLDDVVIFREVNGQTMVALFNLGAIRRGAYADPQIFEDDIIVVGESAGRRLFQNIVQAGALVTTPIVALLNRP